MAGDRSARNGVLETMEEYVKRRQRELANFGREAEAAAHKAYGDAIRSGTDLVLRTQGDVNKLGAKLVSAAKQTSVPKPQISKPPRPTNTHKPTGADLNRNPVVKAIVGDAAQKVGNAAGVVRGGAHAVEGIVDGAVFLGRLASPLDTLLSPPGQSASAELGAAVAGGVDYVRQGIADPRKVIRDVRDKAHEMRVDLDPSATPVAETAIDEARRRLGIGMNQGELAFDVGSFAVGGPLAKSVRGLGALSKASTAENTWRKGSRP